MSHGFKRASKVIAVVVWAASACNPRGSAHSSRAAPVREHRETRYGNCQLNEQFSVVKDEVGNYVKDGPYVSFYSNGQKQLEANYKADKLDGRWQRWDDFGKIAADFTYRDGKRQGPFSGYERGKLAETGAYDGDQRSGAYRYFGFRDLVVAGTMSYDLPTGPWTMTDKAGTLRARARFDHGRLVANSVESLASDGTPRPQLPAQGCAEFAGYALETVRFADVVFEVYSRTRSFPAENRLNPLSVGRILVLDPTHLAARGINEVTLDFDEDDALTALSAKADVQGKNAADTAKELHAAFAKKYAVVSASMPEGECHVVYQNAGCAIILDAGNWLPEVSIGLRSARANEWVREHPLVQ